MQTRLVGREEAGEAVRASQEAHRESLLQECAALRLQSGEGTVREMHLKAEIEVGAHIRTLPRGPPHSKGSVGGGGRAP